MKKRSLLLLSLSFSLLFFQCQEDEVTERVNEDTPSGQTIEIDANIETDQTWSSGNTYILNDIIAVTNNATLTIEPCVVVKGANGATGLIVSQGANLDAQGTATCPIIFTSTDDELEPGEINSPNLTADDVGLWSGVFILGNAPVSSMTNPNPNVIPLLPQYPTYMFGGSTPEDNSGTLKYVSIRHTGYETAPWEVPGGLNLGGVGNNTVIDNIELYASTDDGLKIIGGTVELNNVLTANYLDDGVDIDRGYSGNLNNLIGIHGQSDNYALELDGGEGAENPSFNLTNISFKGSQNGDDYIDFQNNVHCMVQNAYFFGFGQDAIVKLDDNQDAANWLAENLDVSNLEFNTSHLSSGNTTIQAIFRDAGDDGNDAFLLRSPDANVVSNPSTGADKSPFADWTIADANGDLDDF